MESRFACFYLTGQLEWILRKFQLAEVVLVVSKPHVFNLTGQLESIPPVFSTLAATDPQVVTVNVNLIVACCNLFRCNGFCVLTRYHYCGDHS